MQLHGSSSTVEIDADHLINRDDDLKRDHVEVLKCDHTLWSSGPKLQDEVDVDVLDGKFNRRQTFPVSTGRVFVGAPSTPAKITQPSPRMDLLRPPGQLLWHPF